MTRLRFILCLCLRHAWSYLGGAVLLGVTLWMGLAIPHYLQQAIDALGDDLGLNTAQFLERIYWILAFAVAITITRTGSRLLFFIPGRRVEYDLKNRILAHLLQQQRSYYLDNPTGALISRINNDINGIRMMMGAGIMMIFSSFGTLTLAPYYMYQLSPRLTLYCALPILVAFGLLQISVRVLRREQMRQMKAMQGLSDFTVESYNGLDVLKSYRALDWALGHFQLFSDEMRDAAMRMSTIRAYLMPLLTHIVNAVKILLILVGGGMIVSEEMTLGQFTAYLLYLTMLIGPLMGMTFLVFILQRGMTSLVSLLEVLNTVPDLPKTDAQAAARVTEPLREGLRVESLTYAYPDAPGQNVLQDVTFSLQPGEVVGVFGAIGSGKTTLVNLLNRYLTPPCAKVMIDQVDILDIPLARLRKHVVTATQDPFLFSASIRSNITFTREGISDQVIDQVIEQSALREDIERFPSGIETQVGEKGITLSGGQKQRLSLARALLQPCDILILDDVLSAVDHDTERRLINRVYSHELAHATLIISHRISALERADRIMVLSDGKIVDIASHEELIAQSGDYQNAWRLQTEGVSEGNPVA